MNQETLTIRSLKNKIRLKEEKQYRIVDEAFASDSVYTHTSGSRR